MRVQFSQKNADSAAEETESEEMSHILIDLCNLLLLNIWSIECLAIEQLNI